MPVEPPKDNPGEFDAEKAMKELLIRDPCLKLVKLSDDGRI